MQSRFRSTSLLLAISLGVGGAAGVSHATAATDAEGPFLALNETAMKKMMDGMAVGPTADADHDFVAMMVPHHQGAIDMSSAELLYGHDQKLVRIAQEIVVEQLQEIAAMRAAIGARGRLTSATEGAPGETWAIPPPKPTAVDGPAFENRAREAMGKMMTGMAVKPTGDVDQDFVAMMVPHHQGAIDMAQAELRYGRNPQLQTIAQEIVVEQMNEITLMRLALGQPLPKSMPAPTQAFPEQIALPNGSDSDRAS
jgi:uncharacterized protein (DUF305 family)